MSEQEWEAATTPVSGPHQIWTKDTCEELHEGSVSVQVGQEYSVVPALGQSADYEPATKPFLDIFLQPYCMTAADCTEEPGGVCEGRLDQSYCEYSASGPREACREDADCTAKANGSCEAPLHLSEYTLCYPTGVCETPSGSCRYSAPCASNADCTDGANGTCIFPVIETTCSYDSCSEDADCEFGRRCGCGHCVDTGCASDEACAEGERCELSRSWCRGGPSFHCTTPLDECVPEEPGCRYQPDPIGGYWGFGVCAL